MPARLAGRIAFLLVAFACALPVGAQGGGTLDWTRVDAPVAGIVGTDLIWTRYSGPDHCNVANRLGGGRGAVTAARELAFLASASPQTGTLEFFQTPDWEGANTGNGFPLRVESPQQVKYGPFAVFTFRRTVAQQAMLPGQVQFVQFIKTYQEIWPAGYGPPTVTDADWAIDAPPTHISAGDPSYPTQNDEGPADGSYEREGRDLPGDLNPWHVLPPRTRIFRRAEFLTWVVLIVVAPAGPTPVQAVVNWGYTMHLRVGTSPGTTEQVVHPLPATALPNDLQNAQFFSWYVLYLGLMSPFPQYL